MPSVRHLAGHLNAERVGCQTASQLAERDKARGLQRSQRWSLDSQQVCAGLRTLTLPRPSLI